MNEDTKSESLKELHSIYDKQAESYQTRKNEFETLWENAITEDLPRLRSRDMKLTLIKWASIAIFITFVVLKFRG